MEYIFISILLGFWAGLRATRLTKADKLKQKIDSARKEEIKVMKKTLDALKKKSRGLSEKFSLAHDSAVIHNAMHDFGVFNDYHETMKDILKERKKILQEINELCLCIQSMELQDQSSDGSPKEKERDTTHRKMLKRASELR